MHKTGSFNAASSKDADDNTDMGFPEPTVDDGDGPSTSYTDAFKKQAEISTSAGLDGQL